MTAGPPPELEQAVRSRKGRQEGREIRFQCPYPEQHARGDENPSARFHLDKFVWFCDACGQRGGWKNLWALLGSEPPQSAKKGNRKFVATYPYQDAHGQILFEVVRRANPKGFSQRQPNGAGGWTWNLEGVERVLYRLPDLAAAIHKGQTIYLAEGEKDVDNLVQLGLPATTNPGGAGKWRVSYSEALRGAHVAILPDNDPPGRNHADVVAQALQGLAAEVRVIALPGLEEKGDVSDWIAGLRQQGKEAQQIRSELSAQVEAASPWSLAAGRSRPKITVSTEQREVVDQALAALAPRSEIFRRGGCLVQLARDEVKAKGIIRPPESPTIQPLARARLRELMSDSAWWLDGKGKPVHPPTWAVEALMARGSWPEIAPLEGVVESPVLKPDGTVLDRPGYDPHTGLVFLPNAEFPPMPANPGREEVSQAIGLLLEAVRDFPFAAAAHRSAWLSSVLTGFGRFAFAGPSPLNLFDANVRGAGKSLLADVTGIIVVGRPMPRMAPAESDAEERKRITSIALAGDPMVLIDNVLGELGSAALDAALTATSWSDRLLGQNVHLRLPLKVIWFATGNNVVLRGDTSRRCLHARLESPEEYPERRSGFQHTNLLNWVSANRPVLVAAALTVLRGYVVAGRPDQGLAPWGSFEGWSALIRNALVWAGIEDPGETRAALQAESDRDREALERLLSGWKEAVELVGRPVSVTEVLKLLDKEESGMAVLRSAIVEICAIPAGQLPKPRTLGNRLKSFSGRVIQGKALRPAGHSKFGKTWTVQEMLSGGMGAFQGDSGESGDSAGSQTRKDISANFPTNFSHWPSTESPDSPESPTHRPPEPGPLPESIHVVGDDWSEA